MENNKSNSLKLKWLGIDTHQETIIYMREDCSVCRSEGFQAQARIQITYKNCSILATLNTIKSDLLQDSEVSLSEYAWHLISAQEGDVVHLAHPEPLQSLSIIRSKVYGNELNAKAMKDIIEDVVSGRLSDIHIATFLTAAAVGRLSASEIFELTKAMINVGQQLKWPSTLVVDKHCIGGLPANRTSLILVPIVAAYGLMIPKTSSRAITSPSGTADTMEVFAPVHLNLSAMRKVVEQEGGCIVWGGSVDLSPADDVFIRIERAIELDNAGQMIASVLSKKIAEGATHMIIDIPIGPTVKVTTLASAQLLKKYFEKIGNQMGVLVQVIFTDGLQPVGRGIGPALEAKDIVAVLTGDKNAPQDLRERALTLAGHVLEFSPNVKSGTGKALAQDILDNGEAWKKFQSICKAQGGIFDIPESRYQYTVTAKKAGKITAIDNRRLARIAKLAGAPESKSSGIELLTSLYSKVEKNQPLYRVHSNAKGELNYAISYLEKELHILQIEYD